MDLEAAMEASLRKVVLGLGNLLSSDEGLGIHALKMLGGQLGPQTAVELIDGGVLGLDLLPLVEECSHLLVLDAVNAGAAPGSLLELRRDQIPLYAGVKMSEHQVSFQEVLGLAGLRGRLPEHLYLIGIQPVDLSTGLEVSATVAEVLPQVVDRAVAVLREWDLLR
jgi:hydrogenase maturation protease